MLDVDALSLLCARESAACRDLEASDETLDRAAADFHQAAISVWHSSPTSFGDILQRALIARQYADRCPDTDRMLSLSHDTPAADRACAELIEAVLVIARREGHLS